MGLKLLHLHLHGLIRSSNLELGRDADTGGQTLYVLELVKQLALTPEVDQVDLLTRLIKDRKVSKEYSLPEQSITSCARIIRLPFGPNRYIRKELLWPYLDDLANQIVDYLKSCETFPDWIHAHYADAGYVAARVREALGIPFIFTGHSLGREKKRRLLESGMDHEQIEKTYSISRRIEAEEQALEKAKLVITSTSQEAKQQYSRYRNFLFFKAKVIPPGVDLNRFHADLTSSDFSFVKDLFAPFLTQPNLPPLLSISRAVKRKNIPALVEAFGRSKILREKYNLILILGTRKDLRLLDKNQKDVFHQIFELIDKYDLYGKVAYPKFHLREQIPSIFQWAANLKGLFVNPALTEPFGLTLLEAAACGLPIVSTDDGGPIEILNRCCNGLLFDATDLDLIQNTLEEAGNNSKLWNRWSQNGIDGINSYFSWNSHVQKYLSLMTNESQLPHSKSFGKVIALSGIKAS